MAIIREVANYDYTSNYIATLALLCGISCTIIMLRFRGFRASLTFSSSNRIHTDHYEDLRASSVTGAYRSNREEFFGNGSLTDTARKEISPSMVKLPPPVTNANPPSSRPGPHVKPSKSTSDLAQQQPAKIPSNLRKSTPDVSPDPRGATSNAPPVKVSPNDAKKQEKERQKQEKLRVAEQKKRDKLAAQEQAKQEKLRKEREKVEKQQQAKFRKEQKKNKNKTNAPAPPPVKQVSANPLAQAGNRNTMESSISKSSGPPPYTEAPKDVVQNQMDNTGNTSFGKPIDNASSSWDMVSQHRQQINRPVPTSKIDGGKLNQRMMDLQYNTGRPSDSGSEGKGNSEA